MAFGPHSNNPRERRAYAHAMLGRARTTGEARDFDLAHEAVVAAGNNTKARESNFGAALTNIALRDASTRVIVEAGRKVIDPAETGISHPYAVQTWHEGRGYYPGGRSRVNPGFRWGKGDVNVHASYLVEPWTLEEHGPKQLRITEYSGDALIGVHHEIPLTDGNIDVAAVHRLPDDTRSYMASLALRTISV